VAPGSAVPAPSGPDIQLKQPEAVDRESILVARKQAQTGNYAAALKTVEEMGKRSGENAIYFELKGTVQTMAKDYEGAQASFTRMLEIQPDSYVAIFNRAETMMLLGRYAKAESEFAKVEQERSAVEAPVADLARFKRVACLLAQEKLLAATLLVPPVREDGESPALSYSRAMIRWVQKDNAGAKKILQEARTQFSADVDNLYTDTFVELAWGRRNEAGQFIFAPKFR
jgi:Flp pilus assembly protein TadD